MHQPVDIIHVGDTLLSDAFKDAYGFRPRGILPEWFTSEQLEDEYDSLERTSNENFNEQIKWDLEAQKEFEEGITRTIEVGAGDRKTALRWMFPAFHCDHFDPGYALYEIGIGYGISDMYIEELRAIAA